jgi:hypothetical protein
MLEAPDAVRDTLKSLMVLDLAGCDLDVCVASGEANDADLRYRHVRQKPALGAAFHREECKDKAHECQMRMIYAKKYSYQLREPHFILFTLIQKFRVDQPGQNYEKLSDSYGIVVITDEAHRTQDGELARYMRQALPHAAFIGFTGTPLMDNDEQTRRTFGDYVSRSPKKLIKP